MMELFPDTAKMTELDQLEIGGVNVVDLCQKFGTPLYLYDGTTIVDQIKILTGALKDLYPAPSEITYAAKAYFSLRFAEKLCRTGIGVDVVSYSEMEIARKAGFLPVKIHVHGNNKSEKEILAAIKLGVQAIVIDSLDELNVVEYLANQEGTRINVWLRITPGVEVDTHPYRQTGHYASKFGFPANSEDAFQAVRKAQQSQWLNLTGLHLHLGSQIFETQPYQKAVEILYNFAENAEYVPFELSPGGGWGVPYTLSTSAVSVQAWVETVSKAIQKECQKRDWRLPRLILEPGRWIVARAGIAAYSIGSIKKAADGTVFVAVDGGMADNPRPALYQAQYSAAIANRMSVVPDQRVSIVGKFCESGDLLIQDVCLPSVMRGDILVIPVAGAYQLSMASNYNLAERPEVLWVEHGNIEVLQQREIPHLCGWWLGE